MHLSNAVDYALQLQEKDLHMEHFFCPQTTIGGIVYCVHCRGKSIDNQSAVGVTLMKKGLIVVVGVNL